MRTADNQQTRLFLTPHELFGSINHLLLLLRVILILLDKTGFRDVHGLLYRCSLLNTLHPLLQMRHVINLHTYNMRQRC